jgi:mono/diheme cytochrome c family protein
MTPANKIVLGTVLVLLAGSAFADAAKGKALYEQLCISCHGATGKGDGPVGGALPADQKPRNLSDQASYKFAKDDAKFAELLKKGGQAVGLSVLMPPQAQLSDADIASVIEYVKTLK